MTNPIPTEAVEAAARTLHRLDHEDEDWETAPPRRRDVYTSDARAAVTAAAPLIAAQATNDLRAERDSILRRIDRLESDESWWVGGAWGDYGEAVIPLRALSTLTGPLADAGPEWEARPGFAATWGDLRATVEKQADELTDLRAGIEALRDEMPVLTTELCGHEPDEHPEGCCDVCDLAFAIDSEVRDRLDALLRGA